MQALTVVGHKKYAYQQPTVERQRAHLKNSPDSTHSLEQISEPVFSTTERESKRKYTYMLRILDMARYLDAIFPSARTQKFRCVRPQ